MLNFRDVTLTSPPQTNDTWRCWGVIPELWGWRPRKPEESWNSSFFFPPFFWRFKLQTSRIELVPNQNHDQNSDSFQTEFNFIDIDTVFIDHKRRFGSDAFLFSIGWFLASSLFWFSRGRSRSWFPNFSGPDLIRSPNCRCPHRCYQCLRNFVSLWKSLGFYNEGVFSKPSEGEKTAQSQGLGGWHTPARSLQFLPSKLIRLHKTAQLHIIDRVKKVTQPFPIWKVSSTLQPWTYVQQRLLEDRKIPGGSEDIVFQIFDWLVLGRMAGFVSKQNLRNNKKTPPNPILFIGNILPTCWLNAILPLI